MKWIIQITLTGNFFEFGVTYAEDLVFCPIILYERNKRIVIVMILPRYWFQVKI